MTLVAYGDRGAFPLDQENAPRPLARMRRGVFQGVRYDPNCRRDRRGCPRQCSGIVGLGVRENIGEAVVVAAEVGPSTFS
jgi:hypothetical protein